QSDFARSVGLENLGLAGDWVSTGYPTALMERAVSTGRECANAILRDEGIKEAPIQAAKKNGPGLLPQA
ncbi:MAG: FAD-dependent oxidoreductase, partial [Proteobacteria bacterium]|nr:FAD-dependent oxidoreductase [Pseudomonadota bacterium]